MADERAISLDDLAAMVSGGFTEVQGQIAGLRSEVERRFDRLERDMAEVKYLLTDVVRRDEFLELKERVEQVERRLGLKS